ncbi:MAG: hypothetical protein HPY60_11790, partial [Candidatus Methanofastidiosum sp.]|nr:hypothetical protein [Methanofastidiosum sp.]
GSEFYHDNVRTVDLNKDGQCEYILNYYNGGSDIVKEIYIVQNEKLKKVSEIWGGHLWGEYDENGYIQIINIYYTGQKTNPVWKFSILRFDGEKYSSYYAPDLTYGKMRELGLQEYKQKNYEFAEIYFRNVLSVYQYENSTDINNLSLVLIKRNKLKEAKELLFEELKSRKSPETFYNLSVVFRQQNDKKNELKYLVESNQMKQSTFKENRIKELKDELNNSR